VSQANCRWVLERLGSLRTAYYALSLHDILDTEMVDYATSGCTG
jgi:hypothetical protein